jgi:CRP-like cAMP-binding protein
MLDLMPKLSAAGARTAKTRPETPGTPRPPNAELVRFATSGVARAFKARQRVVAQGDPADSVFFVRRGKVKLTVSSTSGKETVIAMLGERDFFGEGCLAGQQLRMASATALESSSLVRTKLDDMIATTRSRVSFFMNKFRGSASSTTTADSTCTVRCSASCCTTELAGETVK